MWRVAVVALVACNSSHPVAGGGSGSGSAGLGPPAGATTDKCEVDSDCAIAYPPTSPCCASGTAPVAMLATQTAIRIERRDCSQEEVVHCPTPPFEGDRPLASCRDHACVVKPRPPRTIDISAFSRACGSDGDCTLVEADRCNPCRCASVPIAAKERGRYIEAFGAIDCGGATITPCGHCDEQVPVCAEGTCQARSTEPMPTGGECANDEDCVVSCATDQGCCEASPCETVISKTRLAELRAAQPAGCKAVKCRAPERASNVTPRCKAGKCFAQFESRLPAR